MAVKIGDAVRVVDREPTPADAKSGLFYSHFRNLTGTVERVYDDKLLCVDVDIESLPDDIRQRHEEIAAEMRDKWISGLSQEARSRLTEEDRQFRLRYKIVVADTDLQVMGGAKKGSATQGAAAPAAPVKAVQAPKLEAKPGEQSPAEQKPRAAKSKAPASEEPKRPSSRDLDAAEEQYLESKRKGK